MLLSELKNNQSGVIVKIRGRNAFRRRIAEMGFIRGQKIKVIKNAPLLDPVEYSVMGYEVSLRRSEASLIEVEPKNTIVNKPVFSGTRSIRYDKEIAVPGTKTINVALVGNPNSGKTSLFNYASKSYEHVGNYGGVTVDTKLARIEYQGYTFNIYDLPGTYSLSTLSPEEIHVRDFLSNNQPDVVVNVVDASNPERNLYLTTQLIDMNLNMVIALNMFDELKKKGDQFDHLSLGKMLNIPMIPTVASKGKGLARLFEAIIKRFRFPEISHNKVHINYGSDIEDSLSSICRTLSPNRKFSITNRLCPRYIAIKLIESDEHILKRLSDENIYREVLLVAKKERNRLKSIFSDDPENLVTDARYGFISGALREVFKPNANIKRKYSDKIDNVLTHKYLGIPIFFLFLWIMFEATFRLGQYPTEWIDAGIGTLGKLTRTLIPAGDVQDLMLGGILGGVGGVLAFLPNILILFLFISLLEDTGYMARAAFIMDRVMHKIGLHGKSFIPLVMGFGCNVPAIMSTRIIESKSNRLLTMLILPFMSCSARLPVYILIISIFFPEHQGTVLFGIYITGILLAVISALIFNRFLIKKDKSVFVMELPPYRLPTIRNTIRHMWNKASQYLQKIAGIILVASIIIWGLQYYPTNSQLLKKHHTEQQANQSTQNKITSSSYLESIGKKIEPVMSPLGFDWKMSVSLLAGVPGKEIVVSTMGVIYGHEEQGVTLRENIRNDSYEYGQKKGKKVFNHIVALSFLMFILVYFPCIAVISTVAHESGSVWWAVFQLVYTTALAWILSFIVYQLGNLIFI